MEVALFLPGGTSRNLVFLWVALPAADLTGGLKIATGMDSESLEVKTQLPDDS